MRCAGGSSASAPSWRCCTEESGRAHPHQLRHNYGTMIRKMFSLEQAQNMLDHSSVEMTRVYAERDREQAVEIARQVG